MTSRLTETNIDCADPVRLADFWCAALGYIVVLTEPDFIEIGAADRSDAEVLDAVRRGPIVPSLSFAVVPEGKTVKNRVHLDISPIDCTQAEEVARLQALGARQVDVGQGDQTWVVMADPEGNEFCVLRSLAPGEFALA